MSELRYTLVGEGPTDRRLLPILTWLLRQHTTKPIAATWADLQVLRLGLNSLRDRVSAGVEFYPCDLLFVHRDADNQAPELRFAEIDAACSAVARVPHVPVVPIRMQETWLLVSEPAIRLAAGRPGGRLPLRLPSRATLEGHADPKHTLHQALRTASELSGRRLARFDVAAAANRLSELIDDYESLRGLAGFDALESELRRVLNAHLLT